MLKNYHIDVGDSEAIAEAIDKQKVSTFPIFAYSKNIHIYIAQQNSRVMF